MLQNFKGTDLFVRELSSQDMESAKEFMDFYNSFVEEDAMLAINEKIRSKEEQRENLEKQLNDIERKNLIYTVVYDGQKICATLKMKKGKGRSKHVGTLTLAVRDGYRRLGLGKFFLSLIEEKAKKVGVKILRLSVLPQNEPALNLYKKFGYQRVASIPKQIEYKGDFVEEIVMIKEL